MVSFPFLDVSKYIFVKKCCHLYVFLVVLSEWVLRLAALNLRKESIIDVFSLLVTWHAFCLCCVVLACME
jgi:hypothetical protein